MFKKERMVLWILSLVITVTSATLVSASEFAILQGRLIDEDCLKAKKNPCPLENFSGKKLALITNEEVVYNVLPKGVSDFKLNNAYSRVIVVKGMKEGNTIMVTDLFQPEKALTKA